MNKLFRFLAILLLFFSNLAIAQQKTTVIKSKTQIKDNNGWKTYKHHDASVELPNYFDYGLLTNSGIQYFDGGEFDEAGDMTIAIEVYPGNKKDLLQSFKNPRKYSNDKIIYNACKDNWHVISSNQAGTIHYEKEVLKGKNIHHLMIGYPENKKEMMDKILPRISKSFQ
ncbi:hypothetical protein ACQ9BO_00605 [Flavobacterium sp. P21]|uniref:hypothetical protein n=1 Tax=Flavobacterium sp. P21 TaxID=3423948 RepID=UPI003D663CBD